MKRVSPTVFAAFFAAAFTAPVYATDVKFYVSEKIAYTKLKNKDSVMSPLPGGGQQAVVHGTDEKDDVLGSKTAIGFALPVHAIRGNIRTEFEFGFGEKAQFDIANKAAPGVFDTKIKTQTYFINAYYDFDTKSAFTPYVGIGAGIANTKSKATHNYGSGVISSSEHANNFAWNASLGGSYAFNKNLSLDVGYRYTDLGNLSSLATSNSHSYKMKAKLSSYELLAGIRYSF